MIWRTSGVVSFCLLVCFTWNPFVALAQQLQADLEVNSEVKHDVSPPVRTLAAHAARPNRVRIVEDDPIEFLKSSHNPTKSDPVVQTAASTQLTATIVQNFDGLASNGYQVPDNNGAVGLTQFVETVNSQYAVYDKTNGARISGPASLQSIWSGFGGLCESGGTPFDPIVLYDRAAGRWFVSQLIEATDLSSFMECIAVSTTADATGSYARYGYSFGKLNDYPKFGIWPDAYYGSYNMYTMPDHTFVGVKVCAYDRAAMLAGQTAKAVCFQRQKSDWNLLPSDLDGNTAPPAGSPNYYLELAKPLPSTTLNLYQFHVDFSKPSKSTFTGPTPISIAPWERLCPTKIVCIPQPAPGEKVDAIGYHLMNRLSYRNFGDHETLVVSHTVDSGNMIAGIRWYEIRGPFTAPVVFQQGTYAKSAKNLWMGTMATDKNGDIALGMNASSKHFKPSVMITGRVPTDALGTMQSLTTAWAGTGVQTHDFNRWGDYASMAVDPADDCTFWYTSQYYKTTGNGTWNTRVVAFKFPGCN
jgi:hypothetical protein